MTPIPTPSRPDRRLRFEIRDILAVVVGYGMAAVFSPGLLAGRRPADVGPRAGDHPLHVVGPGPERPDHPAAPAAESTECGGSGVDRAAAPGVGTHTWAEWAWLFVGGYWVVLGIFVIPARLHKFAPSDALLFGLVPFLAALVSRLVGSDSRSAAGEAGLDPRGGRLAARDLAGRVGLPGRRGPRHSLSIAPLHGIRDS